MKRWQRAGGESARADEARASGVGRGRRSRLAGFGSRKRRGKGAEVNSPWPMFESASVDDGLLDAAASRPYQNRGELRDEATSGVR